MIRNYLKSAFRFIRNNKVFAAINLSGLSVALAASFIMLLFVINEFSFNSTHKNRKQIYRVLNYLTEFKMLQANTPYVLTSALRSEFPEIVKASVVRSATVQMTVGQEGVVVRGTAAQPDITEMFSMPMLYGDSRNNGLDEMNTILISENIAKKFFPGENPAGSEIRCNINNKDTLLIIKGVYRDFPVNSTFGGDCFISSKWTIAPINQTFKADNAEVNWIFDFWNTWIMLADGADPAALEKKFREFEKKHLGENPRSSYSLQNLSDVYLHSDGVSNSGRTGNFKTVKLFSLIAILIVLVASINYIILSTAVSSSRAKEIGIRKTFGADNINIRAQLLTESVLLVLLVLPVALVLARLAMPVASKLFQTRLMIINSNIHVYSMIYLSLILIIGLFSGIYTASYLSRLKVMNILKNVVTTGRNRQLVRSSLIVLQLVIFSSFVAGTMIVRSQYEFAVKKDMGYHTSGILTIDLGRNFSGYSSFINNLKSNPNIIMAAGVMNGLPMMGSMSSMYPHVSQPETKVKVEGLAVDYNFIKAMGIRVIEGREFSEEFGSDLKQSCMLNESAVKALGIESPVGQKIGGSNIIGVVKDFNMHSIHTDIPPLQIHMTDRYINQVVVNYKPGTLEGLLPFIEAEWKKAAPDRPFIYKPIEDFIKEIYSSERNLSTIVSIFALFTLLIAAFGLFGLVLFSGKTRMKEIGIRKVFGSSGTSIIYSFLKTNLVLVLISMLLSVPLTYWFMGKWLKNFAYRISINPAVFIIAFLIAALVVVATVFFHSWKASRTNPVVALKYE